MASPTYNCTQAELYKACRFVWLLCQQYLTGFAEYKSIYTAAFIAENLALINTVAALPDHEARKAPVKELRKELVAERTDASNFFKLLKGYITTAFAADTVNQDAMYGEAGQTYYDKVSSGTWTEIEGLMTAMVPFVQNKKAVLMDNGYMPASFLTRLEEKQVSFKAAQEKWATKSTATPDDTYAKITANNDLKARAMVVINDGQLAFIKNKEVAQKFVWTTIMAEIRPTRPTALAGRVTDGATKKDLANVTVTIAALGLTVTSDEEGRYEFPSLQAGSYSIEIKAEGYKTFVVDRTVTEGVRGRLNVAMEVAA